MPPALSCVIVAFHRPAQLARLVERLHDPEIEIVIVNVDDDADVSRAAGDARIVPLLGNPGFAAAVNRGAAAARTDWIVFMGDDGSLDACTARRLAAVVASGEADVAVPRILDRAGNVERTISALPSVAGLAREWLALPDRPIAALDGVLKVEKWRLPNEPERIDAASAVVVATSRALLDRHALPEEYFLYWEESDWFWHLHRAGVRVQYRPELECTHEGGRDDVRPEKSRLLARNAVRCVRRTQGRASAALAILVVIAWNARLVAVDSIRALLRPDASRRARVRARWAGLEAALTSWGELR